MPAREYVDSRVVADSRQYAVDRGFAVDRQAVQTAVWSPLDISGCILWADATQIVGLNDGDPIATWSDLSGNGNDLVQAVEANKPTYQTNEQNGLSVVRFDVTDFLTKTFSSPITQPLTIVGVVKTGSNVIANAQIDGGIALNARCVPFIENAAFIAYGGAAITDIAVVLATTTWYYIIVTFNGASSSIEVSGNTPTEGDAGAFDHNGVTLGQDYNQSGGLPWNGDMGEYGIINGLISDSDQALLRAFITNKWAF